MWYKMSTCISSDEWHWHQTGLEFIHISLQIAIFCFILFQEWCVHTTAPKYKRGTGKSLSEALILASNNPQYDKRLFIESTITVTMKISSAEHVVYTK